MIGCLMYISQWTRSDITYTTNYLSRFSNKPSKTLLSCIKRMFQYLSGTKDVKLIFHSGWFKILELYVDSYFAGDKSNR